METYGQAFIPESDTVVAEQTISPSREYTCTWYACFR